MEVAKIKNENGERIECTIGNSTMCIYLCRRQQPQQPSKNKQQHSQQHSNTATSYPATETAPEYVASNANNEEQIESKSA